MTMTTDDLAKVRELQGDWACETLARLLPALCHHEIISQNSLEFVTKTLEDRQRQAPEAGRAMFDDSLRRLRAPYGSGHLG